LIELDFNLNNAVEADEIEYSLELKSWTEDGIDIKVDFKDPLAVS
jgi:hypothetical protein